MRIGGPPMFCSRDHEPSDCGAYNDCIHRVRKCEVCGEVMRRPSEESIGNMYRVVVRDHFGLHEYREVYLCDKHWETWPEQQRAEQRAKLAAMTIDQWVAAKLDQARARHGADKVTKPPDEVLQAMYDDRLVAFDEDR